MLTSNFEDIEEIKSLSVNAKVVFYLALTERLLHIIVKNIEGYNKAKETLSNCWNWVEGKPVTGDSLYELLDNEEDTGLSIYAELEEDPQRLQLWYILIDAVSYTIWQAYKKEDVKYLPQPIEIVDEDIIYHFIDNVKMINEFDSSWILSLKEYLQNNFQNDQLQKAVIMNILK